MTKLSHYDEEGQAHMVDVSEKAATRREARARAFVELSDATLAALPENPKGNPLEVARFAGIQAAKQTSTLIPMCHPLALSFVDVTATVVEGGVAIEATAATVAGTGVEMEAMVAASIAALTVYDMTKALDKGIRIRDVELVSKSGGKQPANASGSELIAVLGVDGLPGCEIESECRSRRVGGNVNLLGAARDEMHFDAGLVGVPE